MAQCAHKLNELRSVFRCWWCLRRLLQSVLSECSRSEHCGVLQRTIKCNLDFDRVPGRRPKTTAYSTFSSKNPLKSNAAATAWARLNSFRCSFSIIYLISYWFTHIHAKAHLITHKIIILIGNNNSKVSSNLIQNFLIAGYSGNQNPSEVGKS